MVLGAEFVIVVRDLSWVGDIEGTHSKVGIAQSSQLFVGRVYVLLERPWLQKWVGMSHLNVDLVYHLLMELAIFEYGSQANPSRQIHYCVAVKVGPGARIHVLGVCGVCNVFDYVRVRWATVPSLPFGRLSLEKGKETEKRVTCEDWPLLFMCGCYGGVHGLVQVGLK
jgi:hypothetical protein